MAEINGKQKKKAVARPEDLFLMEKLGIHPRVVAESSRNPKSVAVFRDVVEEAGGIDLLLKTWDTEESKKRIGMLLSTASKKLLKASDRRSILVSFISTGKIRSMVQFDAALNYFKTLPSDVLVDEESFSKAAGVGVVVSEDEVRRNVERSVSASESKIREEGHGYARTIIRDLSRGPLQFADPLIVKRLTDESIVSLIGEKPAIIPGAKKEKKKRSEGLKSPSPVPVDTSVKKEDDLSEPPPSAWLGPILPLPHENTQNKKDILEQHLKEVNGMVMTRFPPEPNGYLHIGHAKAMALDFGHASRMSGKCYLRYDDTNPEAEDLEYIDSILENVRWLGHSPWKITYASDYFQELYDLAVELIRRGRAYVDHQTAAQIREGREKKINSPWRDRPIEESLRLFEDMKKGKFEEGEATLRCKMDMQSDNPCMRDFVAYRVRYISHPKAGDKWCIYPTYDYTHCLVDSLENITHSLCTLEFRIRRESYYWLLDALDLYKPVVWEMSRLNITSYVMSKRKIRKLIEDGIVRGWDDPRLSTLNGLRRRGIPASAINRFVHVAGVTDADGSAVSPLLLDSVVTNDLESVVRRFAVLDPLRVVLSNVSESEEIDAPNHPKNAEMGTRKIPLSNEIFIERSDFRDVDDPAFFGLSVGKSVRLRYGSVITCTEVVKSKANSDEIDHLVCKYDRDSPKKPKGVLHWLARSPSLRKVEFRLYEPLFDCPFPDEVENWIDHINPKSEVRMNGFAEAAVATMKEYDRCQFERIGFFVIDKDSDSERTVLNRIVGLRDKPKKN